MPNTESKSASHVRNIQNQDIYKPKDAENINKATTRLTSIAINNNYSLDNIKEFRPTDLAQLEVLLISTTTNNNLVKVNLSKLGGALTLEPLTRFLDKFPNIEDLNVSFIDNFTDEWLVLIAEKLQKLTSLKMEYCSNITDIGLISASKTLKDLHYIDMSHCINITDKSIISLSENSNNLNYINASFCSFITNSQLQPIYNTHPDITIIYGTQISQPKLNTPEKQILSEKKPFESFAVEENRRIESEKQSSCCCWR